MHTMEKSWKSFSCPKSLLNLDIVLACGQCFRWLRNETGEWRGVIRKHIWVLKQDKDQIFYKSFGKREDSLVSLAENRTDGTVISKSSLTKFPIQVEGNIDDQEEIELKDYFQLDIDLENLYKKWSKNDEVFNRLSNNFGGLRMLRQDPVENLFSFICSQNNHISRISSMVEKLCINYGEVIDSIDDKEYFSFPTLSALSTDSVEAKLRELGFGYRAKFIHQCAKQILAKENEDWLYNLRTVPYKEVHSALCQLPGVGAKVADCVCLMSLDKTQAIPVDTHMWQIAQRDYLPHLKKYKSLTDKIYVEIGDHFRSIYGDFAGWAHSVLFSADLKRFRDLKEDALKQKPTKKKKRAEKEFSSVEKTTLLQDVSTVQAETFDGKVQKRRSTRGQGTERAAKHKKATD